MVGVMATGGNNGIAAAARERLRALFPAWLRRWRERRYFLRNGEIELHVAPLLCRPDRDAIDIGANEGAYLHVMIGHARGVLAFEPVPWLAQALVRKFGHRIDVRCVALSRDSRLSVLRIPVVEGGAVTGLASLSEASVPSNARHCEFAVHTNALDRVYAGEAGFIKIDVEGHEEAVLDGAGDTIARCRPRVLVEMEERFAPGVIGRGQERFNRLGYRGFYVHRRALQPIATFDPGEYQRCDDIAAFTGSAPRAAFDRYINNFLFLPEEDCAALLPRIASKLARGSYKKS